MKIRKIINFENVFCLLFIAYYAINMFALRFYGMGSVEGRIRYYFLLSIIIIGGIFFIIKNRNNLVKKFTLNTYGKKILLLILVVIVFYIFSIIQASNVNMKVPLRTYVQLSLILFPAIFGFLVVNLISTKKIVLLMRLCLYATIIFFFTETRHTIFQFFNVQNYTDFAKGIVFTESNTCTETFFQLFLLFNLLLLKNLQNEKLAKQIKRDTIISAIFAFICHKRMTMLFIIVFLLLKKFYRNKKEINKYLPFLTVVLICVFTYVYALSLQGKIFTNINMSKITTGRTYIMSLWAQHDYLSYGYGTSMLLTNRYLEMDFVQIFMELNIFCVFIFSYVLVKLANRKKYSFLVVLYVLAKLSTSTYFTISFPWIIFFVTIVFDTDNKLKNEKITKDYNYMNEYSKVKYNPLITIIIPVYNVEKYLDECIESVMKQTYQNIEILLIDDGSTDSSFEICKRYQMNDKRIRVIHQDNHGLAYVRNVGIENAKGSYISFVDSDDFIDENMILYLYESLKNEKCDVSICNRIHYYDYKKIFKYIYYNKKNNDDIVVYDRDSSLKELCSFRIFDMSMCGKIFDINLFKNIKFPEGKLSEDAYVMYKIIDKCNSVSYINDALYYYRQRKGSISKNRKINYDYKIASYEQMNYLSEKYPYLEKYYKTAYALSNMNIFNQYITNRGEIPKKSELVEIKNCVRENYLFIKNNEQISFSRKLQAYLFLKNIKLYALLYKYYKK